MDSSAASSSCDVGVHGADLRHDDDDAMFARRAQEDAFAALVVAKQEAAHMQQDELLARSLQVNKATRVDTLAGLTRRVQQAQSVSDLKTALDLEKVQSASSARPNAVGRAMAHVKGLISSGVSEPYDECICAWPVKSINEWGRLDERILVLSLCAVWRVNYDEAYCKLEGCSFVRLDSVLGVRRRAGGDGIILSLAQRDGRSNPLLELKRAAHKQLSKPVTAPSGQRSYERAYVTVTPGGEPTTATESANKSKLAAAIADLMHAAVEACHSLQLSGRGPFLLSAERAPQVALQQVALQETR